MGSERDLFMRNEIYSQWLMGDDHSNRPESITLGKVLELKSYHKVLSGPV